MSFSWTRIESFDLSSASGCGSSRVMICRVRLRDVFTSEPQSFLPSQKRSYAVLFRKPRNVPSGRPMSTNGVVVSEKWNCGTSR